MTEHNGRDDAAVMRRSAGILAIILLGCVAACDSKTEPGPRSAPTQADPRPVRPNPMPVNPATQQVR
jgi:hypothetical protein